MDKQTLFNAGLRHIRQFCDANGISTPEVITAEQTTWEFGTCAYYRPTYIKICVKKCGHVGTAGRAWSYPGYVVDRTPYGVLAHEVSHHVDWVASDRKGKYFGDYSIKLRKASGEKKLTNYCPNDFEWFAEMMRLFITNPALLWLIRPKTYALLERDWVYTELRCWSTVLHDAPDRTINAAMNKIKEAGHRA